MNVFLGFARLSKANRYHAILMTQDLLLSLILFTVLNVTQSLITLMDRSKAKINDEASNVHVPVPANANCIFVESVQWYVSAETRCFGVCRRY